MGGSDFYGRLESLSPDKRALLIQRLGVRGGTARGAPNIPRRETSAPILATRAQEQLWMLDRVQPGSPVYNIPFLVELRDNVDLAALDAAFAEIVRRHESLRTAFVQNGGQVWQRVSPPLDPDLIYTDFRRIPRGERRTAVQNEADRLANEPFVLSEPPLVRLAALRMDDLQWLIVGTFHHIVADAWSVSVFGDELRTLLNAFTRSQPSPLPELPLQYGDYAAWQRAPEREAVRADQLAYWRAKLSGVAPPAQLYPDHPYAGPPSVDGALEYFQLSADTRLRVKQFHTRSTPFTVLLAAFFVLVHREIGEGDILIGSPVADRRYRETEPLIGLFLSFLLLRVNVNGNMTFREVLAQVRAVVTEALENQDVTPQQVIEELRLDKSAAFNPPSHITFGLQTALSPEFGGVSADVPSPGNGTAKFDFSVILAENADGYAGAIEYRTRLFEKVTVRRIASEYVTILEYFLKNPDIRIAAVPTGSPEELQSRLRKSDGPEIAVSELRTLPDRFASWASTHPDSPAVMGDRALTYGELAAASDALADELVARGLARGDTVAVLAERATPWVVAFLAVLKAGGVYVPVDPGYPSERIRYVLRDCNARFAMAPGNLPISSLEAIDRVALDAREGESTTAGLKICETQLSDGAYAIYTSGSTGTPKAALLSHVGLACLARAQETIFKAGPGDRILALSALSFDASVFDLSMALSHGATLCLASQEELLPGVNLCETLRRTRTTILTAPPSVLLATPAQDLPDLRIIIAAGEPCPVALVNRWQSGRRFFNAYGPTECTVWTTVFECAAGQADPPIGRPIPGVSAYITDTHGHLCADGAVGEIAIGGLMVGMGYLNMPELTEEKFGSNPFRAEPGARLYRTGDRGRRRSDGAIDFLGRVDRQVKVRGFRIEPGELEDAINRLPDVAQSAVVTERSGESDSRLVAYVVAGPAVTEVSVRNHLAAVVPAFLMPARIHLISEMPRTPSGKANYAALATLNAPDLRGESSSSAPAGEVEQKLAEVWIRILEAPQVSADSNFFHLGGHSLLVGRLLVEVKEAFGVHLSLKDVFDAPVLRALAARIEELAPSAVEQAPIRPAARKRVSAAAIRVSTDGRNHR